ncbi:MAG: VOC family protein [Hellea sp.]|nr:VOC family protein [Hyphomonadaceae bacterium]NNE57705.1 VOC family protein [Hellea sp.]
MAKVLGLGGVFFRCEDVDGYRNWWAKHMGIDVKAWGAFQWESDGKSFTMMSPFQKDSDYLEPSSEKFMINLRVDDVKTLIDQAKAGGAKIVGKVEDTEYGIFGWFIDPEGIKIELWQES